MMKGFLFLFIPASLWAEPISFDWEELYFRWARFRYNMTDDSEALMRAWRRKENGRKGSEFGMNVIRPQSYEHSSDPQAYFDPTAPEGSEQWGRWSRRYIRELQRFVCSDPDRRAQFLIQFSANFYAGGHKARTQKQRDGENWSYFRSVQAIWAQERKRVRERMYNPIRGPTDDGS